MFFGKPLALNENLNQADVATFWMVQQCKGVILARFMNCLLMNNNNNYSLFPYFVVVKD